MQFSYCHFFKIPSSKWPPVSLYISVISLNLFITRRNKSSSVHVPFVGRLWANSAVHLSLHLFPQGKFWGCQVRGSGCFWLFNSGDLEIFPAVISPAMSTKLRVQTSVCKQQLVPPHQPVAHSDSMENAPFSICIFLTKNAVKIIWYDA
jgi:hypothetical protein